MSLKVSAENGIQFDISRIDKYAPTELIGREAEMRLLEDAWDQAVRGDAQRPRVMTFVALGGEGKTSLVAKWAADLAGRGWVGCEGAFAWSFYSQGAREQAAVSSDLFLKGALEFFGDEDDRAFAGSRAGAFEKGQRLAKVVGRQRGVLILDGLEPLQYAPHSPTAGQLKDQGVSALLKGLATGNRGLCIVTTRYSVPDLRAYLGKAVQEEKLSRLSREAGVRLLKFFDVRGSERRNIPQKTNSSEPELVNEFEKLVEDVKGHALTISLLGSYLRNAHGGDIRRRDLVRIEEADVMNERTNHAAHVMDAYVKWMVPKGFWVWWRCLFSAKERSARLEGRRALALLQLLGFFDRPATTDGLNVLWSSPPIRNLTEPLMGIAETHRNSLLKKLEDAKLLTVNRNSAGTVVSLDAHPLIREYFASRLKSSHHAPRDEPSSTAEANIPSDLTSSSSINEAHHAERDGYFAWQEAHQRLFKHLCETTKDKPNPTLDDLQPLYQAVAHGCQAGLQQEACDKIYRDRILRGDEAYVIRKLGAFGADLGAVACFFEKPWTRVSLALTEPAQAWLLNQAAFCLRGLGRLAESLEPMRAGLPHFIDSENWESAGGVANNLSELELTLGKIAEAVDYAERSVTYADRSGDAFERMSDRTTHAGALHQAGRWDESLKLFREAEQMQADLQPEYPLLYSLRGFKYCDLILTNAERAAWQVIFKIRSQISNLVFKNSDSQTTPAPLALPDAIESCRAVSERATQTLRWVRNRLGLLTIALDHLTLGRAGLYAAVLERSQNQKPKTENSNSQIETSVPKSVFEEIENAVSGLRRAGTQDQIPSGLLTRAWLRSLTGALMDEQASGESAKSDLDEAWEIAERGPMPLFMVDIHLHRARLFFHLPPDQYPWTSPQHDLAQARELIQKHGYLRRMEELEDAEAAIS